MLKKKNEKHSGDNDKVFDDDGSDDDLSVFNDFFSKKKIFIQLKSGSS